MDGGNRDLYTYAMLSNSEIKYGSEFMVRALRAVADPARLRLLRLCSDQPTSVSELAAATADSEPNVSRQLKQLALAGLLRRVRRGQRVEYLPVADSGFARDLLGLLLQRLDPDDPALREARARLRAIEVAARTGRSIGRPTATAFISAMRPCPGSMPRQSDEGTRATLPPSIALSRAIAGKP